ncbi:MAG: hypothetical protein Q7S64_00310, partial [bacterium]|nr:hypothetical protein [bacterium]
MEILYLEPTDEVTRAIERIREVKGGEVALVLPQASIILQSIVNLKLIARTAATARKKIVIVTIDKIGRNLALQVGIPVFGKIDKGKVTGKVIQKTPQPVTPSALRDKMLQETEEITTVTGIQVHRYDSSDRLNQLEEREEADGTAPVEALEEPAAFTKTTVTHIRDASGQEYSSIKARVRLRLPRSVKRVIILLVILAVLGTAGWLYWFFPKTTVNVVLKGEAFDFSGKITALTKSDNDSIPLIIKSVAKSGEKTVPATGTKNVGQTATGKVTLVNEYSTGTQTIAAGQKLRTADGKEFFMTASAAIPGADISVEGSSTKLNKAGQTEGSVKAAEAGDSYNLVSGKLMLPGISETKENKVYASSINTSGGTSETKTIVAEQDIKNAQTQLVSELSDQAKKEALASDTDGFVVEEATSVDTTTFNAQANVGDEVGNFRATGSVEAKVLAVNKSTLLQKVAGQVNAKQSDGKVFNANADQLELSVRSLNVPDGRL